MDALSDWRSGITVKNVLYYWHMKTTMKFRQALFWDVNPKKIDPKKHAQYIIERVADLGNDKEVRWVMTNYRKDYLRRIISKSRSVRPETRTLWMLMLKK